MRTLVDEIKKNWQSLKIGEKSLYNTLSGSISKDEISTLIEFFKERMFLYYNEKYICKNFTYLNVSSSFKTIF